MTYIYIYIYIYERLLTKLKPEMFHLFSTEYKIDGGAYNLTLTEWGQSEPFLVYANPFTCDDLKSLKVPCPLPAGSK